MIVKFKGHIQKLILPGLFFQGVAAENERNRALKLKEYEDTFPPIQDAVVSTIRSGMVRAARSLWEEEGSVHVILSNKYAMYGEQPPSGKELEKRSDFLIESVTEILEELLSARFQDRLSNYILSFIGFYFSKGSHLNGEFHMDYELDRVSFNSWGGLG